MAQFNDEIFNVQALTDKEKSYIGVSLQSLLPTEQYNRFKSDWEKKYKDNTKEYPLWKYALDNIDVTYTRHRK